MKRPFRTALLLALMAWALLPLSALACDCGYAGAPCKAFANTPTVFAGRVARISTINRKTQAGDDFKDRLVFFGVERSYRGWQANSAEVVTGWGGRRLRLRLSGRRALPGLRVSSRRNRKVVHRNLPAEAAAVRSSRGLGVFGQEG